MIELDKKSDNISDLDDVQWNSHIGTYTKEKTKKLRKVVTIGDYVEYDAGTWNDKDIHMLKVLNLIYDPITNTPGFNPILYNSRNGNNTKLNWRVLDYGFWGVKLIATTAIVSYTPVYREHRMYVYESDKIYSPVFWSMYANVYAKKCRPFLLNDGMPNFKTIGINITTKELLSFSDEYYVPDNRGIYYNPNGCIKKICFFYGTKYRPIVILKRNVKTVGMNEHGEWRLTL